jgi:protein involved in polysaccharide export with SLBB domain
MMALVLLGGALQHPNLLAAAEPMGKEDGVFSESLPPPNHRGETLPLSTWIGSGDMVRITALPDTALFLSGDYSILENGNILLPLLGSVHVLTESMESLTASLTQRYAKFLPYPNIQIEPYIRISFLGGFLNPGMHWVNPMHTFSDALSAAQGTVRDDGLQLMRWERGGQVLAVDLTSQVEGHQSLASLGFHSGDQVCITLLTQRDRLPIISLIVSTALATATLVITLVVLSQ